MIKESINRRSFLRASAISIAGAGIFYPSNEIYSMEKDNTSNLKGIEYRILGRTGFKVSEIGASNPDNPNILKALIEAGVNYIDTSEDYGRGQFEYVIGKAIKFRDRKSLFINSKVSLNGTPTKEQIIYKARKCLERLNTDYLDCIMINNCHNVRMVNYKPFHDAMKQLKSEGKLRFVGISNDGENSTDYTESMDQVLLAAVKDGRYDLMLLVYNFLKRDMGEKILKACKEKNIGTTLMKVNPIGSYHLYKDRLEEIKKKRISDDRLRKVMDGLEKKAEQCQDFIQKHILTNNNFIRSLAYRFVLNNKDVHCALFRFSNFEEINSIIDISGIRMTTEDQKILAELSVCCSDLYCRHACGICESQCQAGVPVNTIMSYNYYFESQKLEKYAMEKYAALRTAKAYRCYKCTGLCEKACPYNVPIQGLLIMAHNNLTLSY